MNVPGTASIFTHWMVWEPDHLQMLKADSSTLTIERKLCAMGSAPIFFEFGQERDALLAMDTLEELGYEPKLQSEMSRPTLHIHVDDQDLTSALEIAQAHGGQLVECHESYSEPGVFAMAYDLEGSILIPAHIVNEDWAEGYADSPGYRSGDAIPSHDEAAFDPSADGYDHFQPGIHL